MTATVASACLQQTSILEETEKGDSEENDTNNANFKSETAAVGEYTGNGTGQISSAHTDSESEAEAEFKKNFAVDGTNRLMRISDGNLNSVPDNPQNNQLVGQDNNDDSGGADVMESRENTNLLGPPSERVSLPDKNENVESIKKKKKINPKLYDSSSDENEFSLNDNKREQFGKESYAAIKMTRKNLLKIEKLTDSDSRGRDDMMSRCLSPPTSSDEENLYIGWVAYPSGMSRPRKQKTGIRRNRRRNRQKALCACVDALKCIISPVTKVCKICRNRKNKVWDEGSLKEKLIDTKDQPVIEETRKSI